MWLQCAVKRSPLILLLVALPVSVALSSADPHKWFVFGGIAFIAVCFGAAWVAKLNTRLSAINGNLISEVEKRKNIEAGLLESEKQLKETHYNLESALAAANEANRCKDEFLTNMSHELRTPMNGIIGMTGILQNSELTDEQSEFTDIIMKSSEGLLVIITDILDFSQIEAGMIKLNAIGFDLIALINEVSKTYTPKAREKNLVFSHRVDGDVPAYLKGDPRRLTKVVRYLMGNAVKFTDQGTVSLHVTLAEDEEQHCTLRFVVKDTGVGIDPGRKKRIFDPFSQIDDSSTRKHNGAGLGLALAKRFTEMMGGHIDFESTPARGSTFWFTIRLEKEKSFPIRKPYHVDDITDKRILAADDNPINCLKLVYGQKESPQHRYVQSNGLIPHEILNEAEASGPRILVVEDNVINQRVMSKILGFHGCRAEVVENGRLAVQELCKNDYDVVLMDLQMPEMNGFEATGAIRNPGNKCLNPTVPIIAVTANSMKEARKKCLDAGMDDYLPKPVNPKTLMEKIWQWHEKPQLAQGADMNLPN